MKFIKVIGNLKIFLVEIQNRKCNEKKLRVFSYDDQLTQDKSLSLQVKADEVFTLIMITMLTTRLEMIWANRQQKKVTIIFMMRAKLECAISIRRRSRNRIIREAGNIIENVVNNFF